WYRGLTRLHGTHQNDIHGSRATPLYDHSIVRIDFLIGSIRAVGRIFPTSAEDAGLIIVDVVICSVLNEDLVCGTGITALKACFIARTKYGSDCPVLADPERSSVCNASIQRLDSRDRLRSCVRVSDIVGCAFPGDGCWSSSRA